MTAVSDRIVMKGRRIIVPASLHTNNHEQLNFIQIGIENNRTIGTGICILDQHYY